MTWFQWLWVPEKGTASYEACGWQMGTFINTGMAAAYMHSRLVIHLNLWHFDQRQCSLERGSLQKPLTVESRWGGCEDRCPAMPARWAHRVPKSPGASLQAGWAHGSRPLMMSTPFEALISCKGENWLCSVVTSFFTSVLLSKLQATIISLWRKTTKFHSISQIYLGCPVRLAGLRAETISWKKKKNLINF